MPLLCQTTRLQVSIFYLLNEEATCPREAAAEAPVIFRLSGSVLPALRPRVEAPFGARQGRTGATEEGGTTDGMALWLNRGPENRKTKQVANSTSLR